MQDQWDSLEGMETMGGWHYTNQFEIKSVVKASTSIFSERQESQGRRDHLDPPERLDNKDHPARQECQLSREIRFQENPARQETKVHQVPPDLLANLELMDHQVSYHD